MRVPGACSMSFTRSILAEYPNTGVKQGDQVFYGALALPEWKLVIALKSSKTETWESAFSARADLDPYGDNAIGLFALALRFNVEDLA